MRPWYTMEGFAALPVVLQLAGVAYLLAAQRKGWLFLVGAHALWMVYNHLAGRDYLIVASALMIVAYSACYVCWPRVWRATR